MSINTKIEPLNHILNQWINNASGKRKDDYQKAADRIKEVFENRRSLLNLHAMSLETLPDCLHLLTYVKLIDITNNQIEALPEGINQINHLQHVYISGNPIDPLLNNSSKMDTLTTHDEVFKASLNKWVESAPERFTAFYKENANKIYDAYKNKSTRLDLRGHLSVYYIHILPPEIGLLNQLTHLNLSYNGLEALPPEIGNLRELIYLNLSHNRLTNLPSEIGNLKELIHLDLSYNEIKALSIKIGNLTELELLDLSYNELKSLPTEIELLSQLTHLNLSRNKLKSLPTEIGYLNKLTHLNLSRNKLKSLLTQIGNLAKLTHLDLSRNPNLQHLSFTLFLIPGLRNINIDYININNIEKRAFLTVIRRLTKLTHS